MKLLFLAESVSLAHLGLNLALTNGAFQNGHEVNFASYTGGHIKLAKTYKCLNNKLVGKNRSLFPHFLRPEKEAMIAGFLELGIGIIGQN